MDKKFLLELDSFLRKASNNSYAGGANPVSSQGFKEFEFKEGPWLYKDRYSGFFQSWGQETIWFNGQPVWIQVYGGGMEPGFHDKEFASKTFGFLKQALSQKNKSSGPKSSLLSPDHIVFQPRGPKSLNSSPWSYSCSLSGDLSKFQGHEKILFKKKLVFTHDFLGGLVISK